jgi:hypothetical protein
VINNQIYLHFGIKESTINKEYLLEKEIEKIKKGREKITSGNGYVDILLVMGIICTIVMLVTIATLLI